jgi:hypothetical protein
MMNSNQPETENHLLNEFCNFVDAKQVAPPVRIELKIMQMVEHDLSPSQWLVFIKFFFIQSFAGGATLFICPQFGFGFGEHNTFIHALHEELTPFLFYITCGFFFVFIGAAMSGLLLSYDEIRLIKRSKYIYYVFYSLVASLIFFTLGAEILLFSTTAWILGSIMGNSFGFELVSRVRILLFIPH